MKHTTFITLLLLSLAIHCLAQEQPPKKRINIGLTYPISTNGLNASSYTNKLSINALIGISYAETGLSMAGLGNMIFDSTAGLQIAGLANITGQHAGGTQLAGLANASGNNSGLQIAGLANIAKNSSTQIAGLINIAHNVKGIQLAGLINIADSSDYSIALINIIRNGEKSFSLTTDETLTTLLSFRSGGRRIYGIIGAGYNNKLNRSVYASEAGFGVHLFSANAFRLDMEAVNMNMTDFKHHHWEKNSLRILPSYRFGSHFQLFAGPSFNYIDHPFDTFHNFFPGVTGGLSFKI